MSQIDLAVRRDIPLRGGVRLQVRAEAFNLFNQVSFAPPVNTLTSGLFGQATRSLASSFGGGGITGGGRSPLNQICFISHEKRTRLCLTRMIRYCLPSRRQPRR